MQNKRIRSACSNRGVTLPHAGVPKWRLSWLRQEGADVRTVAEVVAEMVAGGRAG